MGFVRFAPSRRLTGDRPLPGDTLERAPPFGTSLPRDVSWSALVVSHHLDGLLRSPGPCLHRMPDEGSLRFAPPGHRPKTTSERSLQLLVASVARPLRDPEAAPRSAARTLRRTCPIRSRKRVSAPRCLPAVGPPDSLCCGCPLLRCRVPSTPRPCSTDEVTPLDVPLPAVGESRPSMGFGPLQGVLPCLVRQQAVARAPSAASAVGVATGYEVDPALRLPSASMLPEALRLASVRRGSRVPRTLSRPRVGSDR
jgi:hypothetical protein